MLHRRRRQHHDRPCRRQPDSVLSAGASAWRKQPWRRRQRHSGRSRGAGIAAGCLRNRVVLHATRLAKDSAAQEAERQAGIRRLYTNLVALVSLGAWAIGAGGLLWTLAEQAEAPIIGVPAGDWKNPVSLWLTLLVVGAVVWLAHRRHAPWAADRQALPRRLYA